MMVVKRQVLATTTGLFFSSSFFFFFFLQTLFGVGGQGSRYLAQAVLSGYSLILKFGKVQQVSPVI